MIRIFFVTVLAAVFFNSHAQQAPIAIVSSSGTTRLTSTLDSAALLADNNDIIYLPGGSFAGMSDWFKKKVTVIGVGHNPDSTAATGRTEINGNIGFQAGMAEGSVLDGVYVFGAVLISNDVKIFRTNCNQIYPAWSNAENVIVEKSVVRVGITGSLGVGSLINSAIKNTIISGDFTSYQSGVSFENCIFLTTGSYSMTGAQLNTFKNCTFTGISDWVSGHNHFFRNCVFATSSLPPLTDPSNASGNFLNQSADSTFVIPPTNAYDYTNDYKINLSSPALNGGVGGTQIGIYGGASPWLKGNIPPNPHIRTKNVDAATGAGGTLRVRFNVSVQ
jgi:hypothetical protein